MRFSTVIVVIVGFLVMASSVAYACSCRWPESMDEAINGTDVIFYGKVLTSKPAKLDQKPEDGFRRTYLEQTTVFGVKEIWKGNPETRKSIFHGDGNNCCYCGLVFEPGKYYLVMGHYSKDNKITSSSCSGTEQLTLKNYQYTDFDPVTPYNELIKTLKEMPSQKY